LYHPVPVKSGYKTGGVCGDLLCFIAKLEERSVPVNEPGGVGERDAEVESLDELEIGMAQFEDINLDSC